jgi:hypothetical protein
MGLHPSDRFLTNSGMVVSLMLTLLAQAPQARAQDARSGVKLTWSSVALSTTPLKKIEFHGPFCGENLTVSCEGLGAHDFLEISFDLLVMASWDGSCATLADGNLERIGPDYFRLGIQNGPTLIYHTLSNMPLKNPTREWGVLNEASKSQSYPSQVPGVRLPPHTGAREFNTLGYTYPDPAPVVVLMDTTYAIHFIVPHHDAAAVLELNGLHLQNAHDENWGIAHMVVRPVGASQLKKPTTAQIAAAFGALLDTRADRYIPAFQTLISGMDATADWIERNVQPVPADRRVNELLGKVLNGGVTERVAAGAQLRKIGALAEPDLRDARRVAKPAALQEIDLELESLGITPIADAGVRRVIVATRALEVIGTTRALTLRTLLTSGPAATQTDASAVGSPVNPAKPPTSRP